MQVGLPTVAFDLIHVALLLEYVDPIALFRRIHRWLVSDGICSVITQDPVASVSTVSATWYPSLHLLAGRMSLRSAEEVASLAEQTGFHLVHARSAGLPSGKYLVSSIFEKAHGAA